jgi:hypothetical protein
MNEWLVMSQVALVCEPSLTASSAGNRAHCLGGEAVSGGVVGPVAAVDDRLSGGASWAVGAHWAVCAGGRVVHKVLASSAACRGRAGSSSSR